VALKENKEDLTLFLSDHLIECSPTNKIVVVSGGFAGPTTVKTSDLELDVTALKADHEERGTHLVFHFLHANVDSPYSYL